MERLSKIVYALSLVIASTSYAGQSHDPKVSEAVVPGTSNVKLALKSNKDDGYPLTSAIWPERQIPTCWEMDVATFDRYAERRELVRLAIASTWEAASSVRFVGWAQCSGTPNRGISIAVQDVGPHVKTLGSALRNRSQGVVLNFEYQNWSSSCQTRKSFCDHVMAVHEFGHVLGFAHEQNRPDTPDAQCAALEQGSDGNQVFGAWDLASVMNYCNPRWGGDGTLSPTDVSMVQAFYGPLGEPPPVVRNQFDLTPVIYLLTN